MREFREAFASCRSLASLSALFRLLRSVSISQPREENACSACSTRLSSRLSKSIAIEPISARNATKQVGCCVSLLMFLLFGEGELPKQVRDDRACEGQR